MNAYTIPTQNGSYALYVGRRSLPAVRPDGRDCTLNSVLETITSLEVRLVCSVGELAIGQWIATPPRSTSATTTCWGRYDEGASCRAGRRGRVAVRIYSHSVPHALLSLGALSGWEHHRANRLRPGQKKHLRGWRARGQRALDRDCASVRGRIRRAGLWRFLTRQSYLCIWRGDRARKGPGLRELGDPPSGRVCRHV
jgi:hypothetical protein